MTEMDYNAIRMQECNEMIPRLFHVYLPVDRFVTDNIETGPHSYAMVFESGREVYALIIAEDGYQQTLADVVSAVRGMGATAQRFFPPGADPEYFYKEGVKRFLKTYPGRKTWQKQEVTPFYQSFAEYPVALVRIATIPAGIRRFNAKGGAWQHVLDYQYKKAAVAHV